MNGWDIILIVAIAAAVVFAVRKMVRGRKSGCHGGADCEACQKRCDGNQPF